MKDSIKEQNSDSQKSTLLLIAKRLFRLALMCAAIIGVKYIFNDFEPIERLDFLVTIAITTFLWVLLIAQNKI